MTDFEKEQTDAWAKRELRVLSGSIRVLADSEEARQETETLVTRTKFSRKGFGGLGQWAAGGIMTSQSAEQQLEALKARELREHREGILWYLREKLQDCSRFQGSMMEKRIRREMEKKRSMLARAQVGPMPELGGLDSNASMGSQLNMTSAAELQTREFHAEAELSAEQVQMFEKENQDMLQHYQETLDQVRWARPPSHARARGAPLTCRTETQKSRSSRSQSCKPNS
jgi:syntaxin 18